MNQLLFIDDDVDLLYSNQLYFQKEHYHVKTAAHPADARSLLATYQPDCIILDVMLPQQSGFDLFPQIRSTCAAPIIFISGRTDEEHRVRGLLIGGNDYITKPYSLRELAARIQVQLRTAPQKTTSGMLSSPPLSLNTLTHKAYCQDQEIALSNLEYQLLHLLMTRIGQVVPFAELGQMVWGYYSDSDRRTIMMTISRLRKKLNSWAGLENVIETVWSKGYKFVGNRRRNA